MTESTIETTTTATSSAAATERFVRADRVRLTSHPTLNENWLRERIVDDPSILGLGELRLADEGRLRDGRLELLLRDPATGRRFTVLARVGPAEEADLVRVLEQWTVERTRYPEYEHFAVLVAEELPGRVLSAATTLGGSIPLSALQASALRIGDLVSLYFAVVVDQLPRTTRIAPVDRANVNDANGSGANGNGRHRTDDVQTAQAAIAPEPTPPVTPVMIPSVDDASPVLTQAPPEPQPLISPTHVWDDPADARPPATETRSEYRPTIAWHPPVSRVSPGWRLFSMVCAFSLLLCASAAVGWVRSYFIRDVTTFADGQGQDHVIYSDHGHLEWIAPASAAWSPDGADPAHAYGGDGEPRSTKIPYWLPAGLTALLPLGWLIRRRTRTAEPY